jgi:hypothetical protein
MLKKSAGFVLASLRGSTYRSVRLATSLAAALLKDLFEHPRAKFQRYISRMFLKPVIGKDCLANDCRGGLDVVW